MQMPTQRIIGAEITLSEVEQGIARHVARRRYENNRRESIVNHRIGPQSNEVTDLEGFASEMAHCKLFNVYPDFSISPRQGGADCQLLGTLMDVKNTQYRTGHLLAVIGKQRGDADIYALMIGNFPTYYFAGCANASELLVPARIKDFGHGDTYAMTQSELACYCFKHGPYRPQCPVCELERMEW